VDYFYSAAMLRLRGALWPIFAPALIMALDGGAGVTAFYKGFGDGTFYSASPYTPVVSDGNGNPGNFTVLTAGDMNLDGITDIVAADFTRSSTNPDIVTLLNSKDGSYSEVVALTAAQWKAFGWSAGNFQVMPTFTDLNGDGYPDLFAVAGSSGLFHLYYLPGNADGTFKAPVSIDSSLQLMGGLLSCDAGDINHDGKKDLVCAYASYSDNTHPSGVFTLSGDGAGKFNVGFVALGNSIAEAKLADFNGDGILDIAYSDNDFNNNSFTLNVAAGVGDGTFGAPTTVLSDYNVTHIIPYDYNKDGRPDLTVMVSGQVSGYNMIPGTTGVLQIPNLGNSNFGTYTQLLQGTYSAWGDYADINGDGLPDLIVASESDTVANGQFGLMVLPNRGDATFGPVIEHLTNYYVFLGFVGDFNGDGASDVLVNGMDQMDRFLNRGASSINLAISRATATQGQTVTLVATMNTQFTDRSPSGVVTFTSGGVVIGTAPLEKGVATLDYMIPTTAKIGSYTVTANFAGDANFNKAHASVAGTITGLAPAITLSTDVSALTLKQGQTGVVTLSIGANATFSGTAAISVTGASNGVTATVTSNSLTLTRGESKTVGLVVSTTSSTAALHQQSLPNGRLKGTAHILLGFLALGLIGLPGKRFRKATLFGLAFAFACLIGLAGCGSSSHVASAEPGTQTLTIVVAPTGGAVTQIQTVTVTVK
jgi:hypothetical protein